MFTRLVNPEDFTQEQARKESLKKGGIKPSRRTSRGQEFNEDYLNDDSDNEGNVGAIKAQYRRVGDKDVCIALPLASLLTIWIGRRSCRETNSRGQGE